MASDAEARLNIRGIVFEERGIEDRSPDYGGVIVMRPVDGGTMVNVAVFTHIDAERRAMFAEWAEQRIDRFVEHGPEPDGWAPRAPLDDGWQLWARTQVLPSLD